MKMFKITFMFGNWFGQRNIVAPNRELAISEFLQETRGTQIRVVNIEEID